jgi:hypothetical protein
MDIVVVHDSVVDHIPAQVRSDHVNPPYVQLDSDRGNAALCQAKLLPAPAGPGSLVLA